MSSTRALLMLSTVFVLSSCGGDGTSTTAARGGEERIAILELDVTYPEAFSYLGGIRELSDGTILAADPTSQVVLRLDMEAGTADTLGRQGAGPQEYEGPDQVYALPGDSTLLVDLGNGRLITIDPDGRFVDWTPMSNTIDGQDRTVHPSFVDDAGNIYTTAPYFQEDVPDTIHIHRIDRATGDETLVASEWRTEYVSRPRGAPRPMLQPYDSWAVGSDGRVAVVRVNGYSVDWFLPDGRVVHGPQYEVERFPLGAAEKEEELEVIQATATFSRVLVSNEGTQERQMARGVPSGFFGGVDDVEWPETLPVFRVGATRVSPLGEVWVHRMMPAGRPGRVEVFDDQGARMGYVEIPPRSLVVDFGRRGDRVSLAYLARTDDMGLVWLERYQVVREEDRR